MTKKHFTFHASDIPFLELQDAVHSPLVKFNKDHAGENDVKFLTIFIKDENESAVGGLVGYTQYGWMHVDSLIIPEDLRGFGLGTTVIECAEKVAKSRDCHGVWLHTFTFQARPFYEKLGYQCFGELDDHPAGISLFFMKKKF